MTQPTPTQVQHPWRATLRTVLAGLIGLLPLLPTLVDTLGVATLPWVAGTLTAVGAVTRLLAIPAVQAYIAEYLPWLSATPRQP
jgi:hypothetical protein